MPIDLVNVCEDVFRAETRFHLGLGFSMPVASTILRHPDGGLTVISPIAFDDATAAKLEALGTVQRLVAPNCFHHLSLPKAMARWPKAAVWAAPRLERKRADLAFTGVLATGSAALPDVSVHVLDGAPRAGETAFFHQPSRTLVLADLIFNLPAGENPIERLYLWVSDCAGKPGQSLVWRALVKERAKARASAEALIALKPERVLPSHGAPIERDATAELERALWWMLKG